MYLVFGGQQYYASAGGNDFLASCADEDMTIILAQEHLGMYAVTDEIDYGEGDIEAISHEIEWTHVLCLKTGLVVWKSACRPYGDYAVIRVDTENSDE